MLGRLKLRQPCSFWFFGPIHLTPEEPVSDLIDFNDISFSMKEVIEKSINNINSDVKLIVEDYEDTVIIQGEALVSLEDEPVPELKSATIEEPKEEKPAYTDEDIENAIIFLKRNGNIIKGTLRRMEPNEKNISLLLASLVQEEKDKNRTGIIKEIEIILEKFNA